MSEEEKGKRRPRGPGKKNKLAAPEKRNKKEKPVVATTGFSKKRLPKKEKEEDKQQQQQQDKEWGVAITQGEGPSCEVIAARIAKAKAKAATIKKKRGAAAVSGAGGGGGQSQTAKAAAAAGNASTAVMRLDHMSTAEYAANVGARLACSVPETRKMSRVLEARDYRGICLFADSATDVVYCPADVLAKVINPRPLSPRTVARLGPWTPCTGLGPGAGADDDDDDDDDGLMLFEEG